MRPRATARPAARGRGEWTALRCGGSCDGPVRRGPIRHSGQYSVTPGPSGMPPMRILFANPNTTVAVTERIAAVARAAVSAGTEIVAVTGQSGVPYIATR